MIRRWVDFMFLWPCLADAHSHVFLIAFFLSASQDVPAPRRDSHHYPRHRPAHGFIIWEKRDGTPLPDAVDLFAGKPSFFLLYLFPPQFFLFLHVRLFSAVGDWSVPHDALNGHCFVVR